MESLIEIGKAAVAFLDSIWMFLALGPELSLGLAIGSLPPLGRRLGIQVEDGRDFEDHRPWRRGWVVEAISLTLADLPHGNGSKPGTLIFTLKQAGFLEV